MDYKFTFEDGSEALAHHGVKGMKWGVWNTETRAKYFGGKVKKYGKKYAETRMPVDRQQLQYYSERLSEQYGSGKKGVKQMARAYGRGFAVGAVPAAVAGGLGGAKAGGTLGAAVGGPVGSAVGAAIGAATGGHMVGVLNAFRVGIKKDTQKTHGQHMEEVDRIMTSAIRERDVSNGKTYIDRAIAKAVSETKSPKTTYYERQRDKFDRKAKAASQAAEKSHSDMKSAGAKERSKAEKRFAKDVQDYYNASYKKSKYDDKVNSGRTVLGDVLNIAAKGTTGGKYKTAPTMRLDYGKGDDYYVERTRGKKVAVY